MNDLYEKQVHLLLRVLPHIAAEPSLALKGGTAINLFVRDLPRLSVDIDLAYLPVEERDISLNNIASALSRIAKAIEKALPNSRIQAKKLPATSQIIGLLVRHQNVQIKVEVNPVIRGCVYPCVTRMVPAIVEERFGMSVESHTLSDADLYAGKICAALDRQHPRDLFDIHVLLSNEGIGEKIKNAFIVYLISHDRPISELLKPSLKDIRRQYEAEFNGMVRTEIGLDALTEARSKLIQQINARLTADDKAFLLSVKRGDPKWELFDHAGVEQLPAVRWKLQNIQNMNTQKRQKMLERLSEILGMQK
ncbi:MAG TPA: nucleotidyl transferase AbiEii/AbiGii toxin family protein [Gammaproteobacteria bacterium]|nr:nucleotidyl transferase AbiEii/AbiGii toxin family protein [Gammaproteobacteria bacterium]